MILNSTNLAPAFRLGLMKQTYSLIIGLALLGLQSCSSNDHETKHAAMLVNDNSSAKETAVSEIIEPEGGDHIWVFPESKDELGSGGELQIYIDPESHPKALASFAKYELGVGGELPQHRHDKTEEIAYFLSGTGVVRIYEDGKAKEVPIKAGHVWYTPPGAWHSFKNTGSEPLALVFAVIPNEKKGLLAFFRKIGVEPGKEAKAISPEEFGKLASEHDLLLRPSQKKAD